MKLKTLHLAIISVLSVSAITITLSGCVEDGTDADATAAVAAALDANKTFASIEFTETAAPSTAEKMATTFTESTAVVTYTDGTTDTFPMSYTKLFGVNDTVGSNSYPAGTLYNESMNPIMDPNGLPAVAETPDANSLLKVGDKIFLVTHLEYDWLEVQADGSEARVSRKPMSMILTEMSQDAKTGKLTAVDQEPINFSNVDGLWIPCAGSQTPWNTHLGSEEDYDLQYNPLTSSYSRTQTGLDQLDNLYFTSSTAVANPYHYGYIPEVTVNEDGTNNVVKHYSMGRGTWEMTKVMPDGKTAYHGDDGTNVASIMYVADKAGDLTAGTLYAAKAEQTGSYSADIKWVKLGHATDAEVKTLADIETFATIFDNGTMDPITGTCTAPLKRIRAGSTTDECLAVKDGKEQAAAFLETRRYAALLGATTEFNKMEGITVNNKDKHLYMAISYLDKGMRDNALPADMEHLKMAKINAGATLTMPMAASQDDTVGHLIESDYVVTNFYIEDMLRGRDITADALGNIADPNYIANTDNIFFSEKMRTLFIGEDSGTHVNNFVWAYNVDTKKLARILSLIAGAEATGLQVVDDMNGHAYIMSNSQHHGDLISSMDATKATEIEAIGIQKANAGDIGYIGGLPAIK